MATPTVILLQRARRAGIRLGRRTGGGLAIHTTAASDTLARAVRARDAEVLRLADWHHATVAAQPAPCVLCARAAILRDPVDGVPCHKVCVDELLDTNDRQPSTTRREAA